MRSFFKDNRKISSQMIRQMANEAPKALVLWLGFKDICNGYGICVASQVALEDLLHVKSRQTVYNAVKYLHDKGYIEIAKIGNQNAYILNPNLVETMYRDTSKQALANHGIIFKGTIALTKEENPRLYKEIKKFIKNNPAPKLKAINKLHFKKSKSKKHLKIYKTKAEARRHNGYYQPSLIKFNKQKTPQK